MQHDIIHTGGNVYNDYIEFDDSGRIIVVAESGIYVFASDRDYQLQLNPLLLASSPDDIDDYLDAIAENSYIAELIDAGDHVYVKDIAGAMLSVYKAAE